MCHVSLVSMSCQSGEYVMSVCSVCNVSLVSMSCQSGEYVMSVW